MLQESSIQITVTGLREDIGNKIANNFADLVAALTQGDDPLDLRRMHRVIFTTDFAGTLADLSKNMPSGNPITHTDEAYAQAIGKVVLLPHGDDYEIVPVFNAIMTGALAPAEPASFDGEDCRSAVHYIHHELCHVHDDNKKIDLLAPLMLKHRYTGKNIFTRPLAEVCWAEYFANLRSSTSVTDRALQQTTVSFRDALIRTKKDIDQEIRSYRSHADLNRLMTLFQRHGDFLMKVASYTLGYVDGLKKPLSELSPEASNALTGSYFEPIWHVAHDALQVMYSNYPDRWQSLAAYDGLATIIEDYYDIMGFILSTTEDGGAYVTIPFRLENS
jgi:hypothetical protein